MCRVPPATVESPFELKRLNTHLTPSILGTPANIPHKLSLYMLPKLDSHSYISAAGSMGLPTVNSCRTCEKGFSESGRTIQEPKVARLTTAELRSSGSRLTVDFPAISPSMIVVSKPMSRRPRNAGVSPIPSFSSSSPPTTLN